MDNEPVSLSYLSTFTSNQLSQQIKNVTDKINNVPLKFTGPIENIINDNLPVNSLVVTDEFGKITHSSANINQLKHIKSITEPIKDKILNSSNLIHNSSSNLSSNIFLTSNKFIRSLKSEELLSDAIGFLGEISDFGVKLIDEIGLDNDEGIKLIVNGDYDGDLTVNGDIIVENNVFVMGEISQLESSTGVFHTDTLDIRPIGANANPLIYVVQTGNSNIMEIFNNNDQKIVVTKEGYVGVGKTNPEYFIDAASNINVTGNYKIDGNNLSLSDFHDAPSDFPPELHTHTGIDAVNSLTTALEGKQDIVTGIVSNGSEIQIDANINLTDGHNFKINGVDLNLENSDSDDQIDTWKTIGDTGTNVEITDVGNIGTAPTQIDDYTYYHAFTSTTGTNSITFDRDTVCDVLIVGGGGAGYNDKGGGGGGGAVVHIMNGILNSGTYDITVGEGGIGAQNSKGNNSSIVGQGISIIAEGGGIGGQFGSDGVAIGQPNAAGIGGSGGGGGADSTDGTPYTFGAVSGTGSSLGGFSGTIYGNKGGDGLSRGGGNIAAGGGGGASKEGEDGNIDLNNIGGNGGDGIQINIDGNNYYWGGGGGGSSYGATSGNGGKGGGGGGAVKGDQYSVASGYGLGGGNSINSGGNAVGSVAGHGGENTGGGGGGGGHVAGNLAGDGGSGIVIIKWRVFPQEHVTNNDISVFNNNIVVGKSEFYDNFVEYGNMDGVIDIIVNTSNSLIVSSGDIITQDGSIKTTHGHVETGNLNIKEDLNIKTSIRDYSSNVLTKYPQDLFYNDTTDMLAWYKFDDNLNDSSGNGQNLTLLSGGTNEYDQTVIHQGVSSLKFNGSTSYSVTPPSGTDPFNSNTITISVWHYVTGGGTQSILSTRYTTGFDGWTLYANPSTGEYNLQYLINGPTWQYIRSGVVSSFLLNTWYHICVTIDENKVGTFYINSVKVGQIILNNFISTTSTILYVGANMGGGSFKVANGTRLDDIRIYNRALTPEEVYILYQPKLIEFRVEQSGDFYNYTTDMLAWYKFDGDFKDSSGNGKDLTKISDSIPVYFDDDAVVGTKSISFSRTADQGLSSTVDLSGGKSFSVSLWIYRNTNEIDQIVSTENIISNYRRLLISIGSTYRLAFFGFVLETVDYPNDVNKWIHLTCTYHSREAKIYRNGILVANNTLLEDTNFGPNSLFIGKGDSRLCDCKLDDFRIYNRALTPEEITTIYNCSTNYKAFNNNKSLVGWVGETPTIHFDTAYPGQYLKIDLGEYILPKQLTIAPVAGADVNKQPKDFRLYGAQILQGATIYEEGTLRQPTNIPGTNDWYYAFTSTSGTNSITFNEDTECDILVVGGGGGGGKTMGGGGGSGGAIYITNALINAGKYDIVIGRGGNGSTSGIGENGGNTSVFNAIALGGGGGGGPWNNGSNGTNGGSGGGGGGSEYANRNGGTSGNNIYDVYPLNTGLITNYNGNNGGIGYDRDQTGSWRTGGGGGGGIGTPGQNGTKNSVNTYGDGGDGVLFNITGIPKYFAGGGGGGNYKSIRGGNGGKGGGGGGASTDYPGTVQGLGGIDGGESGKTTIGGNGGENTGGGGGGGAYNGSVSGGNGGSGIVVIRWTVTNSDKYMLLLDHQQPTVFIGPIPTTEVTYPLVPIEPIACRYFTLVVKSTYAESPITTNAKISEMELYGYEQRPFNLTKFPRYAMNANIFNYPDGSGITVRCTGSSIFSGYIYYNAFNKNVESGWASLWDTYNTDGSYKKSASFMGTSGEWIMIDLGEQIVLNNIKIYPRILATTQYRCPKTFKIYASNDKDDYDNANSAADSQVTTGGWIEIYDGNNTTDGSQETPYIYIISQHTPYRYYTMVVSEIFPDTFSALVEIRELEFWGHLQEYTTDISNKSWKVSQSTSGNDLVFSTSHDNGNSLIPRSAISASRDGSYTNFTGIHHCKAEKEDLYDDKYIGMIVSSTNKYQKLNSVYDKANIQRNMDKSEWDCLPIVTLTSKENDKDVFGVITKIEDVDAPQREIQTGFITHYYDKEKFDRRLHIAGVGEGGIWVCDCNGNIESGDYISSSSIGGFGMKQSDDIQHNYTVAKATMNCDFNPKILPVKVIATSNIVIDTIMKSDLDLTSNIATSTSNIVPIETEPMFFERIYLRDDAGNYTYEELIDENGEIVYEAEYEIRYINSENNFINELEYASDVESCHKVAFIGCSYHCS